MQWLIDIIIAAVMPTGMIMLWHDTIASIPSGWQHCDGTNGTPDLRDRFLLNAISDVDFYKPGIAGGTKSHNHDFTGDGHSHTVVGGDQIAAGADYEALTSLSVASGTTDERVMYPRYHCLAFIMKM